MFYCDPCARDNAWPETLTRSHGACEVCGKTAACNEMPSRMLLTVTGRAEEEARAFDAMMGAAHGEDPGEH